MSGSPVHPGPCPSVSVLVPTHDNGPTLAFALRSALAQDHRDLEVLVVGDGAPAASRRLVEELAAGDPRVRWFEFPKGPRHGEVHRHAVLSEHARGRFVLYLSDDDLWLPDHVGTMVGLLAGHDWAGALPIRVVPGTSPEVWTSDLADPWFRARLVEGGNRVPLSCGGHTREAYLALSEGWTTTPPGSATDHSFWRKFWTDPRMRCASARRPTVVSVPRAARPGMPVSARLAELADLEGRIRTPEGRLALLTPLLETLVGEATRAEKRECARALPRKVERQGDRLLLDGATLPIREHGMDLEVQILPFQGRSVLQVMARDPVSDGPGRLAILLVDGRCAVAALPVRPYGAFLRGGGAGRTGFEIPLEPSWFPGTGSSRLDLLVVSDGAWASLVPDFGARMRKARPAPERGVPG